MGLCFSEPYYSSDYELSPLPVKDDYSSHKGEAGRHDFPAPPAIPADCCSAESKDVCEWSKRELKSYCWKHGLGTWGNKQDLLARVVAHLYGEEEEEQLQYEQQQQRRWEHERQQAEQLRLFQAEQQRHQRREQERQQAEQQCLAEQAEQQRQRRREQERQQAEQQRQEDQRRRRQQEQERQRQEEMRRRRQQEQERQRQEEQRRLAQLPRCFVCTQRMEVYGTDKMWGDKCCPGHWSDGAQRCISCRRFIPRNERFLVLDAGRKACCRCFETLVVTHQDAQPVYQNVRRFFASQGMQLRQPPPVYVLDSSNMAGRSGDALRRCGVWSGVAAGLFQPVGVPTIRTVQYVQQTPHGPRVVYQHQQLGPQVVQARAIFLRYGMSRLQAGSVLAHEHMHACLQVGTRADQPLPIWMEEGMCQLAAYLYLEDLLDRGSLSQPGRTLCKVLMEGLRDETNPVYGGGFRAAHRAWTGMQWRGLSHMVAYMRQHGRFPT